MAGQSLAGQLPGNRAIAHLYWEYRWAMARESAKSSWAVVRESAKFSWVAAKESAKSSLATARESVKFGWAPASVSAPNDLTMNLHRPTCQLAVDHQRLAWQGYACTSITHSPRWIKCRGSVVNERGMLVYRRQGTLTISCACYG